MQEKEKSDIIKEQKEIIFSVLSEIHEEAQSRDINFFIDKIRILENTLKSKTLFMLMDNNKFNLWYVSKNIINYGYTSEQVMNGALSLGLKAIDFGQIYSFRHFIKWGRNFRDLIGSDRLMQSHTHICGLAFKDKLKRRRVFMLKLTCLLLDKNKEVSLTLLQADDITSLYKSKSYWVKNTCDTGYTPIVRYNFPKNPNKEFQHILTCRELEILKLVAQQKQNIEIGQELDISVNTVERHRKNMISKVGVINMTALITVATMADII